MKIKYLKLKNWLLVSLAGLLGVNMSSCGLEYGCPEAKYTVKGKVTDPSGEPRPGIKVTGNWDNDITSASGDYILSARVVPLYPEETIQIVFADVDSSENGSYRNDTASVVFRHSDLTGGDGHWYEGSATKTLNVTLQPEED